MNENKVEKIQNDLTELAAKRDASDASHKRAISAHADAIISQHAGSIAETGAVLDVASADLNALLIELDIKLEEFEAAA